MRKSDADNSCLKSTEQCSNNKSFKFITDTGYPTIKSIYRSLFYFMNLFLLILFVGGNVMVKAQVSDKQQLFLTDKALVSCQYASSFPETSGDTREIGLAEKAYRSEGSKLNLQPDTSGLNLQSDPSGLNLQPDTSESSGFYNVTAVALLFGQGLNTFLPIPSFTTINGYKINQRLYTGVGIGMEYYEHWVIPVFGEVRYVTRPERKTRPFYSFKLGYSIALQDPQQSDTEHFGGMLFSPEIGFRFRLGPSTSFVLSTGYHYQYLSYHKTSQNWWNENIKESTFFTHYNRIVVRIGLMFK